MSRVSDRSERPAALLGVRLLHDFKSYLDHLLYNVELGYITARQAEELSRTHYFDNINAVFRRNAEYLDEGDVSQIKQELIKLNNKYDRLFSEQKKYGETFDSESIVPKRRQSEDYSGQRDMGTGVRKKKGSGTGPSRPLTARHFLDKFNNSIRGLLQAYQTHVLTKQEVLKRGKDDFIRIGKEAKEHIGSDDLLLFYLDLQEMKDSFDHVVRTNIV